MAVTIDLPDGVDIFSAMAMPLPTPTHRPVRCWLSRARGLRTTVADATLRNSFGLDWRAAGPRISRRVMPRGASRHRYISTMS